MAKIEPGGVVWSQASRNLLWKFFGITGKPESLGGRGADGNMIGMTITAIRTKSNHNIRLEGADDFGDTPDQDVWSDTLQSAIAVIQAERVLDAKLLAGMRQLLLAYMTQCPASGGSRIADLPGLTAS
jgi:hypothetical protein